MAAKATALTFVNLDDISEGDGDDLYRRILPTLRNSIKDSEEVEIKMNVSNEKECMIYEILKLYFYIVPSNISINYIHFSIRNRHTIGSRLCL